MASATSCRPGRTGSTTLAQIFTFKGAGDRCRRTSPTSSRSTKTSSTASPRLTDDQIPNYFKDATFGVPPGEVESTIEPRPGVTIHARQRLRGPAHLRRHPRRHDVRGRLRGRRRPPLPDGRPAPHRPRRTRLLPRRLQRRRRRRASGASRPTPKPTSKSSSTQAPQLYGAAGQQAVDRRQRATSKGSTPTSPPPTLNPALKPGEYTLLEQADGTVESHRRDRDRLAGRRHLRQGGGNELNSALTMQAFVERWARRPGRKAWLGFRSQERPGGADDDLQDASRTRPAAPSPSGPGAAGPEHGPLHADRRRRLGERRRAAATRQRRRRACRRRSKRPATPPTGSWSRPRTRPPATRSR